MKPIVVYEIWYNRCHMRLYGPSAQIDMPLGNLRKIMKLASQDVMNRNTESMKAFFDDIPEVLSHLKSEWDKASIEFQEGYKDPRFDSSGHMISDKKERDKRKAHNNRLMADVKATKARYERFKKRIPKLKEMQSEYLQQN